MTGLLKWLYGVGVYYLFTYLTTLSIYFKGYIDVRRKLKRQDSHLMFFSFFKDS